MFRTPIKRYKPTYLEDDVPEQDPIPYHLLEENMPPKRARSGSYRAMDVTAAAAGGMGRKAIRSTVVRAKSGLLRKAIKKEVDRLAEHRTAYFSPAAEVQNAAWATFSSLGGGWWPISPYTSNLQIGQGSTQGARTGNKIRTIKATLKMIFSPLEYDVTVNPNPTPQMVKIWFVRCKNQTNTGALSNLSSFFQAGAGVLPFQGNLQDMVGTVNSDQFTLLGSRVVKIGNATVTGTGGNANNQYSANNDYKLNAFLNLDVTKYMLKQYDFNDASTVTSQPFTVMIIEAVKGNGNAATAGQTGVKFSAQLHYDYADF